MQKIALSEILNPAVVAVAADAAMADVLSKMASLRISCVVAVDEAQHPLGIFTERDAVRMLSHHTDIQQLCMADVMSKPPLCARYDAEFYEGFKILLEHRARHLIVVDDQGKLAGIVTKGDFLRHMHDHDMLLQQELFQSAQERILLKLHAVALKNSPNAIAITDVNASVVWVNPAFSELTGYAVDEVLGRRMDELVNSGKQTPMFYEQMWNTLLNGQVWQGEMFNRRKNGSLYHQQITITPVKMSGDNISHFIAVKQDITEYNRVIDQLRQAKALMDHTHEGVMIMDVNANILSINPSFVRLTGYIEEEVLGRNPSFFIAGRSDRWLFEKVWQHLVRDNSWQGEVWARHKNGEMFPQLLTLNAIKNDKQIVRYIAIFADISQLKKNQEQIEFMAHHDHLTKLPNRSWIEIRLRQEVERSQRQNYNGAVLFIDLDRFKPVNDSFGHEIGDELLQAAAQRLNNRLRRGDTLGRLNGDEFVLLVFPLREAQDAAVIARDFIATLSSPFTLSCDSEIFISASVGISLYPQDGETAVDLLKNADAAMYLAKENGGNQFSFYSKELNASARSRLAMENDLRRALAQNELRLYYQPKVDLHSGKISGVEALSRWPLPGGGMVSPGEFIPIAEKSNLILNLGSWVIDQACKQMRAWLDQGIQDLSVAINISARQFRSGNLDSLLIEALNRYQVPSHHLELELTESMLMQEPEAAVATMHKLKNIGVKMSLDDFGTGYSSLAYLSRFPIDTLKIDQSFVRNITTDPDAGEIAMSIIGLAHRMNLHVIAEGVETEAQLAYLRRNNCDEIQGFYFSRPLPAPDFEALLQSGKCLHHDNEPEQLPSLLVVSGDTLKTQETAQILQSVNYNILQASSAEQAMEILALNAVELILVVQNHGNIRGVDLLRNIKEIHPQILCLLLVDYQTDMLSMIQAVNEGVVHQLFNNNITDDQLCQHVQTAFEYQLLSYQKNN